MAGLALVMSVPMLDVVVVSAAPASPAPVTPAPVTTAPTDYTVRSGDSLAGIAFRYGVGFAALLRTNSMTVSSLIHPGDVITLPAGARTNPTSNPGSTPGSTPSTAAGTAAAVPAAPTAGASASGTGTTYVVKRGEALAGIAWKHGVKLGALVKANDLTTASVIYPGQTLNIPPATTPVPATSTAASTSGPTPTATTTSATTTSAATTPAAASAGPAVSPSIDTVLSFLRSEVGKPYKFFSAGPDAYDCSGLVVAGWKQIGVTLPHQSQALSARGTAVDWSTTPIQPGDLVFTSAYNDAARITHVGVALSDSTWIHAVGVGRTVSIHTMPADTRIVAVRRVG